MPSSQFSVVSSYLDSCKRHEVPPNSAALSWLFKAIMQKASHQKYHIKVMLNQLEDADLLPLIDFFEEAQAYIDVVDIVSGSPSSLNQEHLVSLMRAINSKLRVFDLDGLSLKEGIVWILFQGDLQCQALHIRCSEIQSLSAVGKFMELQTLNLDNCSSLSSLEKDCFSSMPKLRFLSMCSTRVSNLWTTSAILSKLPSLVELRFQNCLPCNDMPICRKGSFHENMLSSPKEFLNSDPSSTHTVTRADESLQLSPVNNLSAINEVQSINQHVSADILCQLHHPASAGMSLDANVAVHKQESLKKIEVSLRKIHLQEKDESPKSILDWNAVDSLSLSELHTFQHPSPICFEKHYRERMIASLPHLKVLDDLPVNQAEKEMAKSIFSQFYEYLPYKRQHKESIDSVLHMREIGSSGSEQYPSRKLSLSHQKNQCFYTRSLCASKFGSSMHPLLHSVTDDIQRSEEGKRLRPRQFEYHPFDSSLMAIGTLDGEVVVLNHEKGNMLTCISPNGATNSILGLSWLNKHPSKLLAGFESGALRLYDINRARPAAEVTFNDFEQLTSVHVNSTDDYFLTSGYTKKVAIYDMCSGRRLHLFTDIHHEPINVAKFAHHSPNLFVTSSFDRDVKMWDLRQKPIHPCYTATSSRGNVMVCFSPDDNYLLVSAVDNEVKQLLSVDGRLHTGFEIVSTGSAHNYTRSYYMNGSDYIISGSSEESVVRICCVQTGRRLRDVYLEKRGSGSSIFVQSLRSNPFRHFHFAVLAASVQPSLKRDIIKVNLLASSHDAEETPRGLHI